MRKASPLAPFGLPPGWLHTRASTVFRKLLACLALLSAFNLLYADSLNERAFEDILAEQIQEHGREAAYTWLQANRDDHTDNPLYYDWLSRLAMEQGDYRVAIPVLEQLIHWVPHHLGARLDLVIALQLEGRSHEARSRLIELNGLVKTLNEILPPQAERQLEELNKLLIPTPVNEEHPALSTVLTFALGHDSNANRGADEDTITVRIPGFPPFDVALGEDSIKQSDEFIEVGAHLEYGNKGNGCRFDPCRLWLAGATTRSYNSLDSYDQRQIYGGTRKTYGGRYQPEYTLLMQNIRSSEVRFEGFDKQVDEQYVIGLEYRQRLPGLPYLGGSLKGDVIEEVHSEESTSYMASVGINGSLAMGGPSFNQKNRRLLWDAAASWHNRPGYIAGDNQRLRLSANYPFAITPLWQGVLSTGYRWRKDEESFSAVFFGDTVREDHEWMFSANLQRPLGLRWQLTSRAHYEVVDSSIPLFDVSRLQFTLGLAYQL